MSVVAIPTGPAKKPSAPIAPPLSMLSIRFSARAFLLSGDRFTPFALRFARFDPSAFEQLQLMHAAKRLLP